MKRLRTWIAVIFLPLILTGAVVQQECTYPDIGSIPIPLELTAHLENPQVAFGSDCTVFAATRPSSAIGGLVWKVAPGGQPEVVLTIDPRRMYALGEFALDNQGRLYYITVPDPDPTHGGDNTSIDYYRVPGWVP